MGAVAQQSLLRMSPEDVAARASEVVLRLAEPAPERPTEPPSAGRDPAPEPAPAAAQEAAPAPSDPAPGRAWDKPREAIKTPCGRIVAREQEYEIREGRKVYRSVNRYQLWEPLVGDIAYGTTRVDKAGNLWGLAQTRKFDGQLPDGLLAQYDVLVEHELKVQRDAIDKMRAYVTELTLRERDKPTDPWRPAGRASGIFESRGEIVVLPPPRALAVMAAAQKRGGQ